MDFEIKFKGSEIEKIKKIVGPSEKEAYKRYKDFEVSKDKILISISGRNLVKDTEEYKDAVTMRVFLLNTPDNRRVTNMEIEISGTGENIRVDNHIKFDDHILPITLDNFIGFSGLKISHKSKDEFKKLFLQARTRFTLAISQAEKMYAEFNRVKHEPVLDEIFKIKELREKFFPFLFSK